MIIQITKTKNELFLIKEMLPIWQKYVDGFVFFDDKSTDGTYEYLTENKHKFNILSILKNELQDDQLAVESNERQLLYDEALKHSTNIICLDTDEYLDGTLGKEQLEQVLEKNKNTIFYLQWVQYTDTNQIRVDGPWRTNYKPRIGSYNERVLFKAAQMHSEHLPHTGMKQGVIQIPNLFIAHLQWLDKPTVAVKQYFWKITDYVNKLKFNADTIPASAYDASVNNFDWSYDIFNIPLKVDPKIYDKHDIKNSYKYKFIKENVKKHNIPNLNDWSMNIHESVKD
jgi:hypothetical protein